ncbi:TraR/DksA C4-type zinc finger protein [Microbacterium sp. cx-55]|uniref:TraR/DksA family transcriptional regulator n=1 Tax=unclassified Microbacterium TaxID=2609290 RepID=UPI001CBAA038|nr:MULTISPECIES: TraR/DksA C4-type zinc finger protein [unclassified Microbacterium]MBZ4486600.1 TraR/DksA C4-type zinc finger protein [Microbacterium sp. cx-55]MCC4907567.1 TraR/DksA C4-type zinc finger protein [Microbacterium sp. cx-59]UGB36433.1 TraR/DksA C4-type zinc finger protein [Microbacterium sp. cx-55]
MTDADFRAEFDARLEALRAQAVRDAITRGDALGGVLAARGDPAGADDEHDPEGATLSDEWSRLEGLRIGAVREIAEIDAARARLDAGTYGICIRCGRSIPVDRLRVRPTATMCVTCAALG